MRIWTMRPFAIVAAMAVLYLAAAALQSQTHSTVVPASAGILGEHELGEIQQMAPQQQTERLLERAISRYQGALEQIENRLASWTGNLEYTQQLGALLNLTQNSSDLRVRTAGVEITLLSYKVAKEAGEARRFRKQIVSNAQDRSWRLWVIGLLANRGVEMEESRRLLLRFLQDPDEDTRKWAVNALAMLGTDDTIEPLLEVFGKDPSMAVRERAGCGLADSGMMTQDQRRKAIPGLLHLMDDPVLNETTLTWVFHALHEISGQNHGNNKSAWRNWHANSLTKISSH